LKFLDEYVLSNDLVVDSTRVGGLSGIDKHGDSYYIACDDGKNPRFYKASISIKDCKFVNVSIDSVVEVSVPNKTLDLESIVIDSSKNNVLLVSEGSIKNTKNPSFIKVNSRGEVVHDYEIPSYFKVSGKQEPRHNGVFEGLATSFDKQGCWVAMELPLKEDGLEPKFTETTSPVRITYFGNDKKATNQFAYLLDKIGKKPLGNFGVNGVTDLLAYAENKLLIIERSYSTGYGNQGNTIKLYSVDHENHVNTIKYGMLTKVNYSPVQKELVFDFETIREKLTNKSVDNIEGICFGPILPNGNKSIVLIADNNFNDNQLNQFILMEVIE